MSEIKHIYFDLDNTLWDFEHNSRETLREVFHEFQLGLRIDRPADYFVDRYLHHNEQFWDLYRQNKVTKARLRIGRFELTLREFGVEDKAFVRQVADAYIRQCPYKARLNPGVKELLEALHPYFHLHILSNGFEEAQGVKLDTSGIAGYFKHVITSEKASARKPNARIFQFAGKKCGADPNECLMVGDQLEIDVIGALEAGWQAVHYNPARQQHGHESIERLSDLIPWLTERGYDRLTSR